MFLCISLDQVKPGDALLNKFQVFPKFLIWKIPNLQPNCREIKIIRSKVWYLKGYVIFFCALTKKNHVHFVEKCQQKEKKNQKIN